MTDIFGQLPTDDIRQAYSLAENLQEALKEKKPGEGESKISDLFCVQTNRGLEFINKNTFRGRWEAVKNRFGMLFGKKNRLDVSQNLTVASDLIRKVSSLDEKFFKQAEVVFKKEGGETTPTSRDLHDGITKLAISLAHLQKHVVDSKVLHGKDVTSLNKIKMTIFGKQLPVISDEQRDPEVLQGQLQKMFPDLDSKDCTRVVQFLNNYADRGKLFMLLDHVTGTTSETHLNEVHQKAHPLLEIALLKAISFSNEEDVEALQAILHKISTQTPQHTDNKIGIDAIAQVFGDSFIRDSGLEGGSVHAKPYAEIAARCLAQKTLPQTPGSLGLQNLLKNGILLTSSETKSSRDLKEEIRSRLKTDNKCLIYGGWAGHAIVYEIEKTPNGKYSFRVYNEGEGIQYHQNVAVKYTQKVDGCIAFKDISEDMLFKKSFIGSLQALTKLSTPPPVRDGEKKDKSIDPASVLVQHILPMLCGTQEEVPEGVQSLLSPQRSGTCTYKSLLACLANNMSQQEYKLFKMELKLFMLDEFLPALQMQGAKRITRQSEYEQTRKEYAAIKRSIEKFSSSLLKLKAIMPSDKIAQAQEKILLYNNELQKIDGQIIQYEKGVNKKLEIGSVVSKPNVLQLWELKGYVDQEHGGPLGVAGSHFFEPGITSVIQDIEALSTIEDPLFQKAFEKALLDLASLAKSAPTDNVQFALDLLLKKLGSVKHWESLKFTTADQAFKDFTTITEILAGKINKRSRAEDIARVCSFTRGLELAYQQMPEVEGAPRSKFTQTVLSSYTITKLGQLQCSDPFWVKHISELADLPFGDALTAVSYGYGGDFDLRDRIAIPVVEWYNDPKNEALKSKIQASIEVDRKRQPIDMQERIALQKAIIEDAKKDKLHLEEELAAKRIERSKKGKEQPKVNSPDSLLFSWQQAIGRLDYDVQRLKEAIQNKVEVIYQADQLITRIPELVRKDPQYWPWGFREPCDTDPQETRNSQFISSFLFAKQSFFNRKLQTNDLLPPEFRLLVNAGAFSENILKKECETNDLTEFPTTLKEFPRSPEGYIQIPDTLSFKAQGNNTYSGVSSDSRDKYAKAMQNASLNKVCSQLVTQKVMQNTPETAAPSKASLFWQNQRCVASDVGYDDVVELFSIAASPDIQIDSILTYFNENQHKLSDNNWVNLFHAFLCDTSLLQDAFEDPKKREALASRMRTFFNPQIQNALQLEDFSTAANLSWMASTAQRFLNRACENLSQTEHKPEPIITPATISNLFEMACEAKYASHKPVLLETTLACCRDVFSKIPETQDEKKLFACGVMANLMYLQNPTGINSTCIPRSQDAASALLELRSMLSKLPRGSEGGKVLDAVLANQMPELLQKMYPSLKDVLVQPNKGQIADRYDVVNAKTGAPYGYIILSSGTFVPKDENLIRIYDKELSQEIVEILKKQNVFTSDMEKELSRFRCYIEAGNIIHIQDPKSDLELRVYKQENKVYVRTPVIEGGQQEKKWLLHIPKKITLKNIELQEKYVQRQFGDTLLLVDPKTHLPVYRSVDIRGNQTLVRQAVGLSQELTVVNPPDSGIFSTFEDPSCTIFLADKDNQVQEVDFTRLGCTLKKGQNGWECVEQSGWKVAEAKDQFVPHVGPKTGFLVLKNADGLKKVLLPVWAPKKDQEEKQSLSMDYSYEFRPEMQREGNVVECSLVGNQVIPNSLFARFHLARLYLETGSIDAAEDLLFSHEAFATHKKLSKGELEVLEAIALQPASGDIGSRTMRIRLRALYLMEKNLQQFPDAPVEEQQVTEEEAESIAKKAQDVMTARVTLAEEYLARLSHVKPLDPVEELFLMQRLQGQSEKARLRVAQLAPQEGGFTESAADVEFISSGEGSIKSLPSDSSSLYFPSVKTSLASRFRYKKARIANTFPFDATKARWKDVEPYSQLMIKEARAYKNWTAATKKGFLQGIFVMTQSGDPEVKDLAIALYNIMLAGERYGSTRVPGRKQAEIIPERIRIGQKVSVDNSLLEDSTPILRNLAPLTTVGAAEDANLFLHNKVHEYFDRTEKLLVETKEGDVPLLNPQSPEIKDKTIEAKFAQTAKDIEAAKKQLKEVTFTPKVGMEPVELRTACTERIRYAKEELATTERTILQTVASALMADPVSAFAFASKVRTIPTIDELAVVTAKLNYEEVAKSLYPELSADGVAQLKESVKEYLVQKQFVQHLERTIQQVDALIATKNPDDIETLQNVLGRNLESSRSYELDAPHASAYLFIETILNIKMRPDQIENIEKFIAGVAEDKEIVLQMIMGAGKTSVLQPILGFLFARSDCFSVVDVPEALFEPVKEGLYKALGNAFRQFVYTMPYEREMAKDTKFLQTFYDTITEAQNRGACFLRTPRVKHSIVTSLTEAYYDLDRGVKGAKERVELIAKIVNFLQLNEVVQIDEIDMAMNSKIIFKYPVGDAKTVDPARASLLSNFMIDTVTDSEVLQTVSFDFSTAFQQRANAAYSKQGASLTKELFSDALQPHLVRLALKRLEQGVEGFKHVRQQPGAEEYLTNFLTQSTPYDKAIREKISPDLKANILKSKDRSQFRPEDVELVLNAVKYRTEMNNWVKGAFPIEEDRELLGTLADAIKNVLPTSLFKECGSNYGVDEKKGNFVARPYAAPKTPKKSIYGDAYEQVIYSTQMALYYGVPVDAAAKMLTGLQKEAKNEMKDRIPLVETESFKKFQNIMGDSAKNFQFLENPPSDAFLEAYTKAISHNPECIHDYLQGFVYGQIKMFDSSISSTAQTFAGSSKLACGYTGTMHTGILSRTAVACPEEGTDGKTILAVESKMNSHRADTRVFSEKAGKFADQAISVMTNDPDMYVFIDSGGWLKEERMQVFAKRLLDAAKATRPEIEAIVYHNDKGQIVSLEPETVGSEKYIEVPLSSSRYKTTDGKQLTIIAQRYETGTNIPQKPTAKAFMSIRAGMIKREGLQSAFRMRQILYGQSVSYGLTEDVKNLIASGIIDGLLSKESFKKLFDEGALTQDGLEQVALDLQLSDKCRLELRAALAAYQQSSSPASIKERISAFSKCFAAAFNPDSKDIWGYKTVNEALVEQDKNWDAGKQKMREVIEKPLRMMLSDVTVPLKVRMEAFTLFKSFLIQQTKDSPFDKITQENTFVDAATAIDNEIKKNLELFAKLQENPGVKKAYTANVLAIGKQEKIASTNAQEIIELQLGGCVKIEEIPPFLETAADSTGQELEQEVQQEEEVQEEREVEEEREIEVEHVPYNVQQREYTNLVGMSSSKWGYYVDQFFDKRFDKLSGVLDSKSSVFPDKEVIEFSTNLIIDKAMLGSATHGQYHLPGRYLLALADASGKKRYIAVSNQDAALIRNGILNASLDASREATLIGFDGKSIASTAKEPLAAFDKEEIKRICLQAKLSSGKVNYSKEEIALLRVLVGNDATKVRELQKFFEKLISYMPEAAKEYVGSPLQRFFDQAQAK